MPARFDHENLDVYQLQLRFLGWMTDLLEELGANPVPRVVHVVDHLDRAGLSVLLNTAEGNGKRQRPVRAKFFDDARGSATECAACLDALVATRVCTAERTREGKVLLARVVSMPTKLVQLFSSDNQSREAEGEYRVSAMREGTTDDEDDDDDER